MKRGEIILILNVQQCPTALVQLVNKDIFGPLRSKPDIKYLIKDFSWLKLLILLLKQ